MGQFNLPNNSDVNTPSSGKTAVFTNTNGNMSTKDERGTIREYNPVPLESVGMVYGIRWDSVNDQIQPGIVINGSFVSMDYQNYPVQEQMGRYLLTTSGAATKLHSKNSSLNEDGSSVNLDGSSGQVMVQIPRFYQVITRNGDYVYFLISEQSFSFNSVSAWIPPAFLGLDGFYIAAFQGVAATDSTSADVYSAVIDTSGYSISNPNPFTNLTRSAFRSQCSNTGSVFSQWSYGMQEVLRILFLTEYKTWNSQDVLPGHTERGSWDYSYTSQAGETVGLGDFSGSIYDDSFDLYIANSYRGVENPFGNIRQWLDGINVDTDDNQRVWLTYDPDNFSDDTTTNYIDSGIAPGFDGISDYQKDIEGAGKHAPLWPVALDDGADSSSYITDYFYSGALGSGWRAVICGGPLDHGGRAGFGYLRSYDDSGWSNVSFGSRLAAYVG